MSNENNTPDEGTAYCNLNERQQKLNEIKKSKIGISQQSP
jgi:hypothetical protein